MTIPTSLPSAAADEFARGRLSRDAEEFHWLLRNFAHETLGVREAIAVSSDGLLLAASEGPEREDVGQIAAMVAGLSSLSKGAGLCFDLGGVRTVVIELEQGYLLVARISDGSSLGVVAQSGCDIGLVGYQMMRMVARAGEALTPALVTELTNPLL